MALDRGWTGGRAAVALTFVAAVLSVGSGIASIATMPSGPLVEYVPPVVARATAFTGTLTGFVLLANATGLRRGFRAAWWASVVLLPVTAAQGLLQGQEYSYPLVAVSLAALVLVAVNRRRFDRAWDVTATQVAAVVALVGSMVYGTVGAYALRGDHFEGISTVLDAFYFTIVTGSTVGYGDVTPTSPLGRLFGMSVLLVSVSSFAVALGVLLTPAIEARLSKALGRMTQSELDMLEDHVLVLGYGELTEPILRELRDRTNFLVVTPDADRAAELAERGFDVLRGDGSDEETLHRASIDTARAVVVATNDDADDALAVLTARDLRPDVRIVVGATNDENVKKLKRAGADSVISPTTIGGHLLVESALGAEGSESDAEAVADRILRDDVPPAADADTDADPDPDAHGRE